VLYWLVLTWYPCGGEKVLARRSTVGLNLVMFLCTLTRFGARNLHFSAAGCVYSLGHWVSCGICYEADSENPLQMIYFMLY